MNFPPRARRGMLLIETLAALFVCMLLAGLLTGAVYGMHRSLTRATLREQQAENLFRVRDLLRDDLRQASSIRTVEDGWIIQRDDASQVEYSIAERSLSRRVMKNNQRQASTMIEARIALSAIRISRSSSLLDLWQLQPLSAENGIDLASSPAYVQIELNIEALEGGPRTMVVGATPRGNR